MTTRNEIAAAAKAQNRAHYLALGRRWLYGVATAFVPIAVALGWLDPVFVPLAGPFLLALFNVDVPPKVDEEVGGIDGSVI